MFDQEEDKKIKGAYMKQTPTRKSQIRLEKIVSCNSSPKKLNNQDQDEDSHASMEDELSIPLGKDSKRVNVRRRSPAFF
jgi:hypothetical protein